MGANYRHSFGPYRHGTPHAYEPDPKHPSGLSNDEIYELAQKQRYLERRIRVDKREKRGNGAGLRGEPHAQRNLASAQKARQQLRDRQAAMRRFIEEANAKGKSGTTVLTRNPRREWAGDMPKVQIPARTKHGAERMAERKISDGQAADAIINPLHKTDIKTDDLGRREQTYIGSSATIVLNPDTQSIVTAYPTKSRIKRRYESD